MSFHFQRNSIMKFFRSRLLVLLTLVCLLPSCAVKSHQFAHAVYKGNTDSARSFHQPGYANLKFSVTSAPGKYSLPIQYAILQANKPMAKFLLDNGSENKLNGQNLAYYCAYSKQHEMARYFASIGEGSYADISKAKCNLIAQRERNRRSSQIGGLIALGLLAAIISSSGSASNGDRSNTNGLSDDAWTQAQYRSASNPAGY